MMPSVVCVNVTSLKCMLVAAVVRFELSSMQSKEWKERHWQESYCVHDVKCSLWRGSSCAIVLLLQLVALRVMLQANPFNSTRYIIAGMSSTLVQSENSCLFVDWY